MAQDKFLRRIATKRRSVNDSARLRLWAQPTINNVAEVRRLEFGNRSTPLIEARLCRKRAVRDNEVRAVMVSRHSSSVVARLRVPSTGKGKDNRKAERRRGQKKRHRHGRNNFSVTNTSGSGM